MLDDLITNAKSNIVDLPAGRFHYLSWGTAYPDRPAVVLLHGITSSAKSWIRVGPALADRYRVYALDMRGHGESPRPPTGNYGLRETADDAVAFIEALALERPVLVGHSWGGATAILVASGFSSSNPVPDLAQVVLEDPACKFFSDQYTADEIAASYVKDVGRPAAEVRSELIANSPGWTEADIEGKLEALNQLSVEAVFSVFQQGSQMGTLLPQLAELSAPTLLLRADPNGGTTLPGATWDEARALLPSHSRAVQIDGASHNIHRSKFDEFMQAVNAFLQVS
jgi:pimeloyl-ACP methyl ester carboxylesterase